MEELSVISLKPSRIAIYLQGIVWILAMVAIVISGFSWLLKSSLILLLLTAFYQVNTQRKIMISCISFGQQQGWIIMRDKKKFVVELQGEQLVLPWLVVLQWREKESRQQGALALWPDSAQKDDLRRLRVFLRF